MDYTSAGVILFDINSKVLIVEYPEGHWGFPKGYKDSTDNTLFDTAKRELKEEVDILPNFFLDTEKYRINECYGSKKIIYFIAFTINNIVNLCKGLNSYKWIDINDLYSFPNFLSKDLLNKLKKINLDNIIIVKNEKMDCVVSEKLFKIDIPPSKHAYSRLAPLELINDNFKITNIPNTLDAYYINSLLNRVKKYNSDDHFFIKSEEICNCWSVINMLPAIVWRLGKVYLPGKPNGCSIGKRPIDLYFKIMIDFGFKIIEKNGGFYFEKGEIGINKIILPFPSFTGTSISIYLAMFSKNDIDIHNISIEPEIINLISVIKSLGYKIKLDKIRRIIKFKGNPDNHKFLSIRIPFDRNVLVTRMVSDLIRYGRFEWGNDEKHYLEELLLLLINCGFKILYDDYNIKILAPEKLISDKRVFLNCGHYPKICSDWQPLLVILFCHFLIPFELSDDIFENRFQIFSQLLKINNNIILSKKDTNKVVIDYSHISENIGKVQMPSEKNNLCFKLLNIRDAAAILIASTQSNIEIKYVNLLQLFRGYENLENVLGNQSGLFRYEKK